MSRIRALCAASLATSLLVACATVPSRSGDADLIWALEQAIFNARGRGDMFLYLGQADPDYLAWPAGIPVPLNYDKLSASIGDMPAGERIELRKDEIRVHREGRLALSFFTTHRTRKAGGAPANEYFENIHVWLKDDGQWRLVSGMSRSADSW